MYGLPTASLSTLLPNGESVRAVGRVGRFVRVGDRSGKQLTATKSSHGASGNPRAEGRNPIGCNPTFAANMWANHGLPVTCNGQESHTYV